MTRFAWVLLAAAAAAACDGKNSAPPQGIRAYSEHYAMRIITEPERAHARERTTFRVVIRDKQTGQPVEGGEGLLYGNTQDTAVKVWDSFVQGAEPGTYYAKVNFIVATNWFLAIRFHKDSTQRLEQVEWTQQVYAAQHEKE